MLSGLHKPCGIFWDIENVDVPKNCAADVIAQNIRATLIFPNQWVEREFFCVCNVHQLPKPVGTSLESIGVTIVQPFYNVKENAADTKILLLISKFIQNWGRNGCAIIVVTGDSDFLDPLLKLKLNHDLTVYLIHPKHSFSKELLWSADFSYQLEGVLLIETSPTSIFRNQSRSCFLKVFDLPQDSESHNRIHEINRNCTKFLNGSRVLRIAKGTVWIGYTNPNQQMTEKEFKILASLSQVLNIFSKLELVKSIWPESFQKTRNKQPKNDNQLLKGDSSKNADNQIRANIPVFQEIKPCRPRNRRAKIPNKPKAAPQSAPDLSPKEKDFRNIRKKIICLTGNPNSELTTHWSLMYNIVDKCLDYNIKKVILQGKDFWLQFGDEIKCKKLADKIIADANYLIPLLMKKSISPSKKLISIISSYPSDNPFCLNMSLGLNYLKSSNPESFAESTGDQLVEKIKSISVEFKCIFVKLFEGIIWAGFPSIRTCENAKKKINSLNDDMLHMQSVQLRLFPDHLFEFVGIKDFVGEAQDLIKLWLNKKQSPVRGTLQKCFSPPVTVSTSIESNTDSNSVIREEIDASRHNVPCLSEVDSKSSSTYMETVSSVHGYFIQISNILKLLKRRNLRKPFVVQSIVDFVGVVPKAAMLNDDNVYLNYNTFDEVKCALKVVESKLYENFHQLQANSIPEAPTNWLNSKKYYFGFPRVPPQPPKKEITYICITPVSRKEIKSFTSILLSGLQSFYVYFIRHFDESSWIGIGTQKQAEEAVKNFTEKNTIDSKLNIKIVKKLPKDFWKTVREDKQSSNEASNIPIFGTQSENGSMKSLSELSSASTVSLSKKPVKSGSPHLGWPSKPIVVSNTNAAISSLTFGSVTFPSNGVIKKPETPLTFKIETKEKLEPIPKNNIHHPLINVINIPKSTQTSEKPSELTKVNGSSSNQLMIDGFHYMIIKTSSSFISDEVLSFVKKMLEYSVLIKQLPGSIFVVFDDPVARYRAQAKIHGLKSIDKSLNRYFVLTTSLIDKAPAEFVASLSRSEVYDLWRLSKGKEPSRLDVKQASNNVRIERANEVSPRPYENQAYVSINSRSIPTPEQKQPTSLNSEKNKKKNCVVS